MTKESFKDENRVDTIQSISNNNEDAEEGENKLVMCLKRYKGDEDRCFPPRKRDKSTYCQVPECYNPMLVIGSCTISAYDSEPYFFEMLAHFVIKKHPANPKRRIIYYNLEDEARNCESDPAYFNNILEIRRTKRYIELKNNEISLTKTNEVVLTPEQEKEYADLEKLIVKLEDELGVINPAPGENTVDYHAVSEKQNDDLMEARKTYNEFKKIIRDNIIKKKEAEKKILEEKLKKMEDELAGRGSNTGKVSKKICLKYNYEKSSVLPKLLYEDDRRNLVKGYKSDWIIEKVFDDEGEETGFYKIRGEIGGKKFNLSKKKKPELIGFLGFAFPNFEGRPKKEDQLWMIKEVGDLNADIELGEVQEEADIKVIGKEADDAIKDKHSKKK